MGRLQKHKYGVLLFMVFSAAGILYSLNQILNQEVFQWIMNQREYKTMMAETAELFAAFCLTGFLFPKNIQKLVAAVLITAVFLWAHVAFVPVLVSGLYLAYILFFLDVFSGYPYGNFQRMTGWHLTFLPVLSFSSLSFASCRLLALALSVI